MCRRIKKIELCAYVLRYSEGAEERGGYIPLLEDHSYSHDDKGHIHFSHSHLHQNLTTNVPFSFRSVEARSFEAMQYTIKNLSIDYEAT